MLATGCLIRIIILLSTDNYAIQYFENNFDPLEQHLHPPLLRGHPASTNYLPFILWIGEARAHKVRDRAPGKT